MNYTFPVANPPRCCRAIGKLVLLSADADRILDSLDNMPYAFTVFSDIRFLDTKGDGTEDLVVSADFSGVATVGINTAVFRVLDQKIKPIAYLTTAVSYQLEIADSEMYRMTLDAERTRLAQGRRYYFVKETFIEKGKPLTTPRRTIESTKVARAGIVLGWN